jgi:uncharacterized oxidoreductase
VPTFAAEPLGSFARALFVAAGVPADEAETVSRSLVGANLRGHDSHGVMRVLQYCDALAAGRLVAGAAFTVLSETPALLAADGNWGLGQVQAHRLLNRLLDKAAALGVAAGTLRRCGHTGRLGEYAEAAADRTMAFLGTVNSHGTGRRVAPPGGSAPRISTNPICLGAPTPGDPLVLDIGTSVVAEGKVRVHHQKGEPVPEGWLLDAAGRPTTDPGVLYREPRGSLLPLGGSQGYKGFGLGLMLDVLAGGLSGGPCSHADAPPPVGNTVLFVVFDPARFGGTDHFLAEAGALAESVRSCPPAQGAGPVQLPGDPELRALERRRAEGIPVSDGTWKLLTALAERLGVPVPVGRG